MADPLDKVAELFTLEPKKKLRRKKVKVEARPVTNRGAAFDWAGINWKHGCSKCGTAAEQHRQVDARCPAIESWGRLKKFPSFVHAGESPEADRKIDAALEKYWSAPTTFSAMR